MEDEEAGEEVGVGWGWEDRPGDGRLFDGDCTSRAAGLRSRGDNDGSGQAREHHHGKGKGFSGTVAKEGSIVGGGGGRTVDDVCCTARSVDRRPATASSLLQCPELQLPLPLLLLAAATSRGTTVTGQVLPWDCGAPP